MRSLAIAMIVLLSLSFAGPAAATCVDGDCLSFQGDEDQWCIRYQLESGPGYTSGFYCRGVIQMDG